MNTTYERANHFANTVLGYLESDGGRGYFVRFNGKTAHFASYHQTVTVLSDEPTRYYVNVLEAIEKEVTL